VEEAEEVVAVGVGVGEAAEEVDMMVILDLENKKIVKVVNNYVRIMKILRNVRWIVKKRVICL
jgi:hypothetical protein